MQGKITLSEIGHADEPVLTQAFWHRNRLFLRSVDLPDGGLAQTGTSLLKFAPAQQAIAVQPLKLVLSATRAIVMQTAFDETMSIDVIMRTWPETIHVILRHHMLCVGCPVAPFHTVADACREHGVDKALFLRELLRAIGPIGQSP